MEQLLLPWSIDEHPLDVANACACLKANGGTPQEWVGISEIEGEHIAYAHPKTAELIARMAAFIAEVGPLLPAHMTGGYGHLVDEGGELACLLKPQSTGE